MLEILENVMDTNDTNRKFILCRPPVSLRFKNTKMPLLLGLRMECIVMEEVAYIARNGRRSTVRNEGSSMARDGWSSMAKNGGSKRLEMEETTWQEMERGAWLGMEGVTYSS
jgi:hypothetical protein